MISTSIKTLAFLLFVIGTVSSTVGDPAPSGSPVPKADTLYANDFSNPTEPIPKSSPNPPYGIA